MPSDDIYNINKPLIKDGHWILFPNSTVSEIDTMDCNDAVAGECYFDKSLDQCIKSCEQSPECNFGYYIENTNHPKGNNICVPLRDGNIDSNPMYRLRKQSIYPELKGTKSTVFINKHTYPFPPEQANNVFYMDNLLIKNIETNTFLGDSPLYKQDDEPSVASFNKNGGLIVQPLQVPADLSVGTQYVTVKYGDSLIFNIPNTTLVMANSTRNNTQMEWITRSFNIPLNIAYTIHPIMKDKKNGDDVLYSDIFSIKIGISILGIETSEEANIEKLYYSSYDNAKIKNENVTFKFIPKMKGWYCNNDAKCTEVSLEKMVVDEKGIGTYEGLAIGRNPGCWGVCKYKVPNQPRLEPLEVYKEPNKHSNNLWLIFIPIIIILATITMIIKLH